MEAARSWQAAHFCHDAQLGQAPSTTNDLPQELLGNILSLQTFFTPVEGWVDGVYRAEKKPGPTPASGRHVSVDEECRAHSQVSEALDHSPVAGP